MNPEPRVAGYMTVTVGWVFMCTPFPGVHEETKGGKPQDLECYAKECGVYPAYSGGGWPTSFWDRSLVLISTILKLYPNHVI